MNSFVGSPSRLHELFCGFSATVPCAPLWLLLHAFLCGFSATRSSVASLLSMPTWWLSCTENGLLWLTPLSLQKWLKKKPSCTWTKQMSLDLCRYADCLDLWMISLSINMHFTLDFNCIVFFSLGDYRLFCWRICCFVYKWYSKIHVSSPVKTVPSKFGSNFVQLFHMPKSSVIIFQKPLWILPSSLAISRYTIGLSPAHWRRSTSGVIFHILTFLFEPLCHSRTWECDFVSTPYICCSSSFLMEFPQLNQKPQVGLLLCASCLTA